jgi:citrate lyase subunit beta/citryl-CoA lyase
MLFVPGNNPAMVQTARLFGADVIILDLEDAVAPSEKDAARELVASALMAIDYGPAEKCVRLNGLDACCSEDLVDIVPSHPDLVMLPKVNRAEDIISLAGELDRHERPGQKRIGILAIIESPQGLAEVHEIANSHFRLMGLLLGAEDYTAMVGSTRTKEGAEIAVPRALVVNAAAAGDIESFDAVFTDANDEEGLLADTRLAKNMGFTGKAAVNPRQIKTINDTFNPSPAEIEQARRIVKALAQAEKEGSGVASVGGKMVDAPVAKRALNLMNLARKLGLAS